MESMQTHRLPGPFPESLLWDVWGRASEGAFPTTSQVRLRLPAQGSHFQNPWCRKILVIAATLRRVTTSSLEGGKRYVVAVMMS